MIAEFRLPAVLSSVVSSAVSAAVALSPSSLATIETSPPLIVSACDSMPSTAARAAASVVIMGTRAATAARRSACSSNTASCPVGVFTIS